LLYQLSCNASPWSFKDSATSLNVNLPSSGVFKGPLVLISTNLLSGSIPNLFAIAGNSFLSKNTVFCPLTFLFAWSKFSKASYLAINSACFDRVLATLKKGSVISPYKALSSGGSFLLFKIFSLISNPSLDNSFTKLLSTAAIPSTFLPAWLII